MQLEPFARLQGGKYEIIRTLGQGGFGITYEAEQVSLGRKVAIKEFFMKDCCERTSDTSHVTIPTRSNRELVEKFKSKFLREARMIASFDHPSIVRIHDVFEENGTAYYVMENLPGGSLSDKVKKEGPLPEVMAEKFIRQVADALAYIHTRGTVHLDVKPSNILLNAKGDAVLIDFGISKHYDKAGEQTSSTPVGISNGYAPLEQGRDGDVSQFTPATDIYALGATLYTLVTGKVPPEAADVNEDGLDRPAGLSDSVWNAIESAMQPRRKDRPQSVAAFLAPLPSGREISPLASLGRNDRETASLGRNNRETASLGRNAESDVPEEEVTVISDQESLATSSDDPSVISSEVEKSIPSQSPKKKSKVWLYGVIGAAVALLIGLISKETEASTGYEAGHEWVDMGLSVKWATMNLGATTPGDYGNYYAWGETSPKSDYSWTNLKYCSDTTGDSFTKYVLWEESQFWGGSGGPDNKSRLDITDDAARRNWGGSWRMPTDAEWTELRTKCTWSWTSQNGHNGYKVTSKSTGNSIFLPAAGYRDGGSLINAGSGGGYWSSSLRTDYPYAWYVGFNSGEVSRNDFRRRLGFSVRPVLE